MTDAVACRPPKAGVRPAGRSDAAGPTLRPAAARHPRPPTTAMTEADDAPGAGGPTSGPADPAAWLAAAARGDAAAWARLVRAYSGRVYGLLMVNARDPELAEELTQATFVALVEQLRPDRDGGYRERGRFEPWLFRIAMNKLRDEMRRRRRQARPTDPTGRAGLDRPPAGPAAGRSRVAPDDRAGGVGEDPAAAAERAETLARLRAAVANLPEADREVLHLRHTARLSFREIAEILGQPLGTVLARGHRALKKLRAALDTEPPAPA